MGSCQVSTVRASAVTSGDRAGGTEPVEPIQRGPDLIPQPTTGGAGQQIAQELLGDPGGGDLLARVGGQQLGEQFGALLEGESLSCAQQPTTVDPLDITLASAATRCVWVTRRRTASTISLAFLTRRNRSTTSSACGNASRRALAYTPDRSMVTWVICRRHCWGLVTTRRVGAARARPPSQHQWGRMSLSKMSTGIFNVTAEFGMSTIPPTCISQGATLMIVYACSALYPNLPR